MDNTEVKMSSTEADGTKPRPSAKPFRFGYLVHDVSRIRRTVMDQVFRPLGVTRSQWSILTTLSRGGNDGMTQVDLARLLEVGKVTVGGLVDRLEATGHVERRADASDRRIKRVFITKQGYDVLQQMIDVATKLNERTLSNVSREDRLICEDVLFKVKQNLKEVLKETSLNWQEEFGSQLGDTDYRNQP
ncbi:MarR family winged helix-turn-helix transcriptional regulator [Acidocella sp. KAb 2-4]|uniref:MarR family winged helix-turn-helix transcriptional regulator n=1 Tax=Acidocella sp. KAb 2-4 TaxID=2885158 RepID=UPI001D05C9EC|nr:MarR family transcriptional regulator [Acidocella sp. KAb 2-4]